MLGAIIGDVVGSRFEFNNYRHKDFSLFTNYCTPTDDSVMTLAVAEAILNCKGDYSKLAAQAVACMQKWGREYPGAGYGGNFRHWLVNPKPQPYNSFGNGSAMRVSPCGWAAQSLEEAIRLADLVTAVTHNHPEGMKGAEATAAAIYLARTGSDQQEIRQYLEKNYYRWDFTLDAIRDTYEFDESCQGSVPQAFEAFFEAQSLEETIRNAVSLGGDCDTTGAIAGGVAGAYFGVPEELRRQVWPFLDHKMRATVTAFEKKFMTKA